MTAQTQQPLPEATKEPCNECPWRRDSEPGFLDPHDVAEWLMFAHSGGPIGCHKTIREDDWSQPGLRQCAGAAIFRANDGIAPNRADVAIGAPDRKHVFTDCTDLRLTTNWGNALTREWPRVRVGEVPLLGEDQTGHPRPT